MEANSVSPDGNYKIETDSTEFRMSHWVDRPRISDVRQGEAIFDLWGTEWDVMNFAWKPDNSLWMELRKYPGDCDSIDVTVDLLFGGGKRRLPVCMDDEHYYLVSEILSAYFLPHPRF